MLAQVNGGTLAPGTWTWQFQYQLPPDLPGVFFTKHKEFDGDKIKAAIGPFPFSLIIFFYFSPNTNLV